MRKLIVLIALVPMFASATGTTSTNGLYKDGKYAEVISEFEPKIDRLNKKQTLKLAHSYYMEKNFFKAKILYYQYLDKKELTDIHKIALADILLSTGMLDLSINMLLTCDNQASDKFNSIMEKIEWVKQNNTSFSISVKEKVRIGSQKRILGLTNYGKSILTSSNKQTYQGFSVINADATTSEKITANNSNAGDFQMGTPNYTSTGEVYFSSNFIDNNFILAEKTKENKKTSLIRLGIMKGQITNDQVTNIVYLSFCSPEYNYTNPFVKGDTMFFSSDQAGGFGGFDLYYITKDANNEWTVPVNMGSKINTALDETYPTVNEDKLFFSSEGLPGFGGADIFYTNVANFQNNAPINLGKGVNSGYDEFSLLMNAESNYHLISNRDHIKGYDEIYKVNGSQIEGQIRMCEMTSLQANK